MGDQHGGGQPHQDLPPTGAACPSCGFVPGVDAAGDHSARRLADIDRVIDRLACYPDLGSMERLVAVMLARHSSLSVNGLGNLLVKSRGAVLAALHHLEEVGVADMVMRDGVERWVLAP